MVLEDDGFGTWRCLGLTAEQRNYRLGVVVWPVGIVERVKQYQLRCVGNPDVRELGLCKLTLHHILIALQELADQLL